MGYHLCNACDDTTVSTCTAFTPQHRTQQVASWSRSPVAVLRCRLHPVKLGRHGAAFAAASTAFVAAQQSGVTATRV